MNPSTLISLGLPTLIAWCLADDYQKARIKRGLVRPLDLDPAPPPMPLERVAAPLPTYPAYAPPPAYGQPLAAPQPAPPLSVPKSLEQRKAKLLEVLHSQGLKAFYHLAHYPGCIRATGYQRSGKTTRIQCLALFRQLEDPKHPVVVATPHKPTAGDSPWPSSFSVHGEGNDWSAIRKVMDGIMTSLDKGETHPRTYILDEFSGYLDHGGIDSSYLQEFTLSMVRETAKHNCQVILLQHGDTVAMSGGIKGLQAAVWGNFPTLQCQRLLVQGRPQPAPQAALVGGGFPEEKLMFPDWLRPQWLLKQFPELAHITPSSGPDLARTTLTTAEPDFVLDLASVVREDQAITMDSEGGLPPHLEAILEYIRRNGSANARQIQTRKLKSLTDINSNTIERIQLMLDTLLYEGCISLAEDGNYIPWVVGRRPG